MLCETVILSAGDRIEPELRDWAIAFDVNVGWLTPIRAEEHKAVRPIAKNGRHQRSNWIGQASQDSATGTVAIILRRIEEQSQPASATDKVAFNRATRPYMNLRRLLNAATSSRDRSNHSPFFRLASNRLCQYASMPVGSSVVM